MRNGGNVVSWIMVEMPWKMETVVQLLKQCYGEFCAHTSTISSIKLKWTRNVWLAVVLLCSGNICAHTIDTKFTIAAIEAIAWSDVLMCRSVVCKSNTAECIRHMTRAFLMCIMVYHQPAEVDRHRLQETNSNEPYSCQSLLFERIANLIDLSSEAG